jgi:hypothetical protein
MAWWGHQVLLKYSTSLFFFSRCKSLYIAMCIATQHNRNKKNPSHITFPSLTSHHLLLLQTIAFISIQMEHKDTSQSKVQIKLNILRLLGSLLLNKHCSTFRACRMQIELVGNLRLHGKLNASYQVFLAFKHCQNLCIVDLSIKESHEVYSSWMLWFPLTLHVLPTRVSCHAPTKWIQYFVWFSISSTHPSTLIESLVGGFALILQACHE